MKSPSPTSELLVAVINEVQKRGGSVTKTKMLKLLYLLDIANYRSRGVTLTGFEWIFHLYGPWTAEFDDIVEELVGEGAIEIDAQEYQDGEVQFFEAEGSWFLEDVVKDLEVVHEASVQFDCWADSTLGELLDYVYFETEPMSTAQRGAGLDFSTIDRSLRIRKYVRSKSERVDSKKLVAMKSMLSGSSAVPQRGYTSPRYDQAYTEMMAKMDAEN